VPAQQGFSIDLSQAHNRSLRCAPSGAPLRELIACRAN
jgi:hypothetical protein